MTISIQSNIAQVRREIQTTAKQARFAAMLAINDTAKDVVAELQAEMRHVFDRPTPFILRSMRIVRAEKGKLYASIFPSSPGGKAVDPASVLQAEVHGGLRSAKRSERALQRTGMLAPGWAMVPAAGAPRDAYGNVPGPFIVQLLSWFHSFGEQGYRANMTDKRRRQIVKPGRTKGGAKTINGVEYFISRGRGTWASTAVHRSGWLSRPDGQTQHLPAGIWARRGIHGSDIKPIFLFVRMPSYKRRLDFFGVAETVARRQFGLHYAARLLAAVASAR